MAQAWNWLWLAVAFVAELGALVALAWWGWMTPHSTAARVLLAVGTPLVAAVLWGVFAAPQAPVSVPALRVLVQLIVFGGGVVALVATGHPRLAIALAVAALLGTVLSSPPVTGPAR